MPLPFVCAGRLPALFPALLVCAAMGPARATDFTLYPVTLPGGISIFGSLSTDGSIGPLGPAQLTGWNITVRQTSRIHYDRSNALAVQARGVSVSSDGRKLLVKTSPDGLRDGGLLAFGSFGPGPEFGVQWANFTGSYANGGTAFYLNGGMFEWQSLGAANGVKLPVGKASAGSAVFKLAPVHFASGATLTGTVTTDGAVGKLTAAQLLDWSIDLDSVVDTVYWRNATGGNSSVLPASTSFSTDGTQLFVNRPGGYLGFGVPPSSRSSGAGAVLADFSGSAPPKGQVGYYDAFSLQFKSLKFGGTAYPVATVKP